MLYWLMRKDEVLLGLDISESGEINRVTRETRHDEFLPLAYRYDRQAGIRRWWSERSVPLGQGRVKEMLEERGLVSSSEYLVRNLGLSLTDYYWIKPAYSSLSWETVNLFDNDFRENLMVRIGSPSTDSFTPNSTLQGQLEKSWQIRNGKRVLVKGNSDRYSTESLNEVFACTLHSLQHFENYTPYRLLKIKNRPYVYGSCSEAFTSQNVELVSARSVLTSEKGRTDIPDFERLIAFCSENGADGEKIRHDLDYMIMTDYILSNRDRHMNNIGVLRRADDLTILALAPLYDTGKSMFTGLLLPMRYADLVNGEIRSFAKREQKQLTYVTDRSLVDASKLPDSGQIRKLYQKDPNLPPERIEQVCEAYERKVEAFTQWQR